MEKIKYDGLNIKIEETDERRSNNLGRYLDTESLITLNKNIKGEYKRSVLTHECIHMVLLRLGEFDLNKDEGFVERLSNAIFRLYEDNYEILLGVNKDKQKYDEYDRSRLGIRD